MRAVVVPGSAPVGIEIALVRAGYSRALKASTAAVSEFDTKPLEQTVSYARDKNGSLVEICTPVSNS